MKPVPEPCLVQLLLRNPTKQNVQYGLRNEKKGVQMYTCHHPSTHCGSLPYPIFPWVNSCLLTIYPAQHFYIDHPSPAFCDGTVIQVISVPVRVYKVVLFYTLILHASHPTGLTYDTCTVTVVAVSF